MLRFSLLGSGSSGNALLVVSPAAKILIDDGLSFKQVQRRVAAVGETLEGLKAVFVTHEHRDHVNGIGTLARRLKVPVYATEATYENLPQSVGELPGVEFFESGDAISVDGLELTSYSVCHDAVDPVMFTVECAGVKLGLASDLGRVSALVKTRLADSHALILESNHCPAMLRRGSYPRMLQQRISSSHGHLSNSAMNSLLATLMHDRLQWVVLAHVSQENNSPELAREMASHVLRDHPAGLHVALQDGPTPLFEIAP